MARITLNSSVLADPGETRFKVAKLVLDIRARHVWIDLHAVDHETGDYASEQGLKRLVFEYRDAEAEGLIRALNTANLSTKSLQRRIVEKLQADGYLGSGTIDVADEA